jgi:hypothetical protein
MLKARVATVCPHLLTHKERERDREMKKMFNPSWNLGYFLGVRMMKKIWPEWLEEMTCPAY